MRDLKRNQRVIHYANVVGTEPIIDEYGNDTLDVRTLYGSPALLRCNVSANMGQEAVEVFGSQTEYSRTISLTGSQCPLVEGTSYRSERETSQGSADADLPQKSCLIITV